MQEKMSAYFQSKSDENAYKGKEVLEQMESLIAEMQSFNDQLAKDNKGQNKKN